MSKVDFKPSVGRQVLEMNPESAFGANDPNVGDVTAKELMAANRRSAMVNAYATLLNSPLLAAPEPDTASISERLRAALLECTGDIDLDGRVDIDLEALVAHNVFAPGTTAQQLSEFFASERAPLTVEQVQAADETCVPFIGDPTPLPPTLAGLVRPFAGKVAFHAETAADFAVDVRQVSVSINDATQCYVEVPVRYLQLADGSLAPYGDELPAGARVLDKLTVCAYNGGTIVFLNNGADEITKGLAASVDGCGSTRPLKINADGSCSRISGESSPITQSNAVTLLRYLNAEMQAQHDPSLTTTTSYLGRLLEYLPTMTAPLPADEPTEPAERAVYRARSCTSQKWEELAAPVTERFGVAPRKWAGYIADPRFVPMAQEMLAAARPELGISASFLYTIAMGEGLLFYGEGGAAEVDRLNTDFSVDGFGLLGVDSFGSVVGALKKKGFIPQDFNLGKNYTLSNNINEKGDHVTSANFPDLRSGLVALTGMLADYRAAFIADATKQLGSASVKALSEEQLNFFTYLYFNVGKGRGHQLFRKSGLKLAEAWTGKAPASNTNGRYNALQRVATWQMIVALGLFN